MVILKSSFKSDDGAHTILMLLICHSCFIGVTCSIPDDFPSHVSPMNNECSSGSTVEYNTICSFACDTGYRSSDSTLISCTKSGALSADLPNCEGITLPFLRICKQKLEIKV